MNTWSIELAPDTTGTIQEVHTKPLYCISPAATPSCPITPIGTVERANIAKDAHAETVAQSEETLATLQAALLIKSVELLDIDHVEER